MTRQKMYANQRACAGIPRQKSLHAQADRDTPVGMPCPDEYEKLNHRNHKKDDEHLNKHAMHLIRLYLLCLDILEKEDIVTYRGDDLPLLMSIRRGDYQLEDGTYRPEFFEMVSDFEKRLNYAKQNTSLPEAPDMKKVEEFVVSVNRRAIDA